MGKKKLLSYISILLCLLFTTGAFANEQLIFVIDLIRHGDRTPIHEIPKAAYHWKQGLGELTPEGVQRELQLGTMLRKKYIEQYHLLPPQYAVGTLYVRSTDVRRTIASARSVLLGLYPLENRPYSSIIGKNTLSTIRQEIPIYIVPKDQR